MFRLFLDVTWKPVSCPLERRIEELLGTLQPGDGLLVNELSLLGPRKGALANVQARRQRAGERVRPELMLYFYSNLGATLIWAQ